MMLGVRTVNRATVREHTMSYHTNEPNSSTEHASDSRRRRSGSIRSTDFTKMKACKVNINFTVSILNGLYAGFRKDSPINAINLNLSKQSAVRQIELCSIQFFPEYGFIRCIRLTFNLL